MEKRGVVQLRWAQASASAIILIVAGMRAFAAPADAPAAKAQAAPVDSDRARQAAKWALAVGGTVRVVVEGKPSEPISDPTKLPPGPFETQEIDVHDKKVFDKDLSQLAGLVGLKKLVLTNTFVTGAGLIDVAGIAGLDFLDLGQTRITDAGLKNLVGLKRLRVLNLPDNPITDAGLAQIVGMPNLKVLNLDGTDVTDAGLAQIESAKKLVQLHLARTAITDLALTQIGRLPRARMLILEGTLVSDVGLAQLGRSAELKTINLKGTLTTRRYQKMLVDKVPECKITANPADYQAAGNGSQVGRRVLAPKEPRTANLKPGLTVRQDPGPMRQSNREAYFLVPATLGAAQGAAGVTTSLAPWKYEEKNLGFASGYLKIDKAGEYAFTSTNQDDRNALWIGTAMVCGYREGRDSPVKLQLPQGYIPILCAGDADAGGSVTVRWQPPGQTALVAIPNQLLFHQGEPAPGKAPQAAAPAPVQAWPLPRAIEPPTSVTVTGLRGLTPVRIEEFCTDSLPPFLKGATLFAPRYKPGDANTGYGRVDVEVKENTGLFMAAVWGDSPLTGEVLESPGEQVKIRELAHRGWAYVGELRCRDPLFEPQFLYWRQCQQGEKLVLRTRRFRPPMIIVPAARDTNPLDTLPSKDMPDRIAEAVMRSKAGNLLRSRRFDDLETWAQSLRTKKPRTKTGHSLQQQFYFGVLPDAGSDAEWDEELALYEDWLAAKPESVSAHIALAAYWERYAWHARGGGYASTVKDEGWRLFQERVATARDWVDKARELTEKDAYLCQLEMLLAIDLGYSSDEVERIIRESLEIDPMFKGAILSAARYYLPRWYGHQGDLEAFAARVTEMTQKEWGHSVYAGIVWDTQLAHGTRVFQDFDFDWELVKQGYADYREQYPTATIELERLALLACYKGDREAAREAFALLPNSGGGTFGGPDALAGFRRWAQDDFLEGEQSAVFEGPRTQLLRLEWFGDGTRWVTFDNDNQLLIWDAETGEPLNRFEINTQVWIAAINPADTSIVTVDFSGTVQKFDLQTGQATKLGKQERLLGATLSPDGREFLTTGRDMKVRFWDVEEGKLAETWETKPTTVQALAFLPDGQTLVTGSFDRRVAFWDRATKKKQAELPQFSAGIKLVRVSADGKLLAVLDNSELSLWQLPTREKLGLLELPKQPVNELVFSPDGKRLAIATGPMKPDVDGLVVVWDTASRKLLHTYHGHKMMVRSVQFSPDSKILASCGDDMTIRIWQGNDP